MCNGSEKLKEGNKMLKNQKTVTVQCNLVKGLPKLSFDFKRSVIIGFDNEEGQFVLDSKLGTFKWATITLDNPLAISSLYGNNSTSSIRFLSKFIVGKVL